MLFVSCQGIEVVKLDETEQVFVSTKFAIADGKVIMRRSDLDCSMLSGIEMAFVIKGKLLGVDSVFRVEWMCCWFVKLINKCADLFFAE